MDATRQREIFARWMQQHQGLLYKVVHAYADTAQDRDDLFQEIVLRLWTSLPEFRGDSAESTWIYRVALYGALNWLRGEKKHRRTGSEEVEQVLTPINPPHEHLEWLYAEIRSLEPTDRTIALMMLDNYSYQEIADTLGLTENHVGVKIHRIKKRLKAQAERMALHEF